jgi:hypothetical protein
MAKSKKDSSAKTSARESREWTECVEYEDISVQERLGKDGTVEAEMRCLGDKISA